MHKALIAEQMLALISPPDKAETMAGDLAEEAAVNGSAWFAASLAGLSLALFFQAFGAARVRMLRMLAAGLVLWFAAYVGARIVGAALGLQPLVIDAHDVPGMPAATLVYLGATMALANFMTGFALGLAGPRGGVSPVMPLAVFWVAAAIVKFCVDTASGVSTWYCTVVYLGGIPALYVMPLLLGGALAAQQRFGRLAFRLGVPR